MLNNLVPNRDEAFADNQLGWYIPKYDVSVVVTLEADNDRLKITMNFDKPIPPAAQEEVEAAIQNALAAQLFDGGIR